MDVDEKLNLIKRNTEEIVSEDELKELLKKKKKPVVYLGTAITGRPHVGYYMWVLKMCDFLKAGFKVKVLLADLHGALDNCPWPLLEKRYEYYEIVIKGMFKSVGADLKNIEFAKGSKFQLDKKYIFDVLKMSTFSSLHDCQKASSEVVKQSDNPKLSGLIYPIMQSLDEVYLDADIQYGGVDQRKIMMFARENLPKMGYERRIEVMTPLIPGLTQGGKMSSSVEYSKIDLLDDKAKIKGKIDKAYCPEGVVEENGVLAFCKYVIFLMKGDRKEDFVITRPEKFGGNAAYKNYEQLETDFKEKKLHPMDLKSALVDEIDRLLDPIRKDMKDKEKLIKEAYPEK